MGGGASLQAQFEQWPGPMGAPTSFTIPVMRYLKQYNVTEEQLAMVAVVQREYAAMNPNAMMKDPITVEDVLNSRMIAYPFRLFMCCLVTDVPDAVDSVQTNIHFLKQGSSFVSDGHLYDAFSYSRDLLQGIDLKLTATIQGPSFEATTTIDGTLE